MPCWDVIKSDTRRYRPVHYPLQTFYLRYGLNPTFNGYSFDQFVNDYTTPDFWNAGRGETYSTFTKTWYQSPIAMSAGSGFRLAFRAPSWWPVYYMNAQPPGGRGATIYATSQYATSPDSQFIILDLNGGQLNDGDPVALQLYYSQAYYVSAVSGGGGPVTADATSIGPYERFTIRKLAGLYFDGPIANGDNIALQSASGYYLHADGYGGGSTISATGASAGAYETFNYTKVDDQCTPPPPPGR